MMKPPQEEAGPRLVPVPPEAPRARRLLPVAGFITLFLVHELLGWAGAFYWYHDESFAAIRLGWYGAWEALLMGYFAVNHLRLRGQGGPGPLRLALFWAIQAAWFALGAWCFGVLFEGQPFAVEGVGAWLAAAYLLAAVAEGAGRKEPPRGSKDAYFDALSKRPWGPE
jgi:hypothetical protein